MNTTMLSKCALVATMLVLTSWLLPSVATADYSIDQSQILGNAGTYFWAERFIAQTFTAGMNGQLAQIDLRIDTWTGLPSVPATISVVNTINGVPSGSVLGTVDVPNFNLGWNSIDFLTNDVSLTSGTLYGILLSNNDPSQDEPSDGFNYQWDNPYAPGELWQFTPGGGWEPMSEADIAFRTWVVVPEPSSIALLLIAAIGSVFLWRRRV